MQKTKAKQTKTSNKGITLVALVITIIVLLILAAVGIGAIAGPEGLIAKAKQAAEGYNDAAHEEAQTINEILNMINGNNQEGEEDNGITAIDVANDPTKYYGKIVTGYNCENNPDVDNWQIFHSDGENIYLITNDYVGNYVDYSEEEVPEGPEEPGEIPEPEPDPDDPENIDQKSDYVLEENVVSRYTGAQDIIAEGDRITKWISHVNRYPQNTNMNIKSTAWLLDTNVWNIFKDEENAEYAIGAPTLEMFIASFNTIFSEQSIDYDTTYEEGYRIKLNTEENYKYYNIGIIDTLGMYVLMNSEKPCTGYWIASPDTLLLLMTISAQGGIGSIPARQ